MKMICVDSLATDRVYNGEVVEARDVHESDGIIYVAFDTPTCQGFVWKKSRFIPWTNEDMSIQLTESHVVTYRATEDVFP